MIAGVTSTHSSLSIQSKAQSNVRSTTGVYRNYKGPFRESGQAMWAWLGWPQAARWPRAGSRTGLYAAPLLDSAGPKEETGDFRLYRVGGRQTSRRYAAGKEEPRGLARRGVG